MTKLGLVKKIRAFSGRIFSGISGPSVGYPCLFPPGILTPFTVLCQFDMATGSSMPPFESDQESHQNPVT
jgi:hypothetical protein